MPQNLLVISPVRNEAAHIERVARAMAGQTRPPDQWVVVDDRSDDGTLELLERLAPEIAFMTVLRIDDTPVAAADLRDRLATGRCSRNFNVGLAAAPQASYTHVAKLDGDVELPPRYYEVLLDRFAEDPTLGIACGDLVEPRSGGYERIPIPSHHVHGALKCYSRRCFQALGGTMPERLGWDTIDETYARMWGYRTRSYRDLAAIHHRPLASADGILRGRARHGRCAYIAHFGLGWVALRSLKLAMGRPRGLSGAAFLYGYLAAAARSVPQVDDEEFKRYVRRELRGRMLAVLRVRRLRASWRVLRRPLQREPHQPA